MNNADLLAIKSELTNDPQSLGLDTNPAHDEANANKLNAVQAGDAGFVKTLTVKRRFVAGREIFGKTVALDAQALTDKQHAWFSDLTRFDHIDPFQDVESLKGLQGLFSEQTQTRTAHDALMVQAGSRITQLFQEGRLSTNPTVTPSNISDARAAT